MGLHSAPYGGMVAGNAKLKVPAAAAGIPNESKAENAAELRQKTH